MTAIAPASLLALLGTTVLATASPTLEDLQRRCTEQERQIRELELENARLREQLEPARRSEPEKPAPAPAASPTYTVKPGDSLARIARRNGSTVEDLARLNGIENPGLIRPGQVLKLAVKPAPERPPEATSTPGTPAPAGRTHKVTAGETFYSISRRHGLSVEQLRAANPGIDPAALRVGQELVLAEPDQAAPRAGERTDPVAASTGNEPGTKTVANRPARRATYRSVRIEKEITFGEFASRHGMAIAKLNALNGLELESSTLLAEGSELYVSAQP